jgi:hypothetical protein
VELKLMTGFYGMRGFWDLNVVERMFVGIHNLKDDG